MGKIADTGFGYKINENEVLYRIYSIGGGLIPECLKGTWTDIRQMEIAVKAYLGRNELSKPEKEAKQKRKNVIEAKKRPNKLKHPEKD